MGKEFNSLIQAVKEKRYDDAKEIQVRDCHVMAQCLTRKNRYYITWLLPDSDYAKYSNTCLFKVRIYPCFS